MQPCQQYATTYHDISNRPQSAYGRQPASTTAKSTNVILGNGHSFQRLTMNESDFAASKLGKAESTSKNTLGAMIKKANFTYGSSHLQSLSPYTTVSHVIYNDKGNPAKVKATLDDAKKKDLRTNHFNIGGPTANITKSVA